ncbi:TPA: hypothetical protein ACGO8I_002184 [Streptococcus suis]
MLTAPATSILSSPVFGSLVSFGLVDSDVEVLAEVEAEIEALVLAETEALTEADVLAETD